MTQFGINCAPQGRDDPHAGTGRWIRTVLSGPPAKTVGAIFRYHLQNRDVLGIATKQTMVEVGGGSNQETARRVFDLYGASLDALQVWNEPDGGGDASDVASVAVYNGWLKAFRDEAYRINWRKPLVAAGLVSGQPSFLKGVDMRGYLLAIHPYDQRPYKNYPDWGWGNLPDLLDAYRPYLPAGTKFWLTECSRTTPNDTIQARYAAALVQSVARRPDVAVCLWYCWQDWRLGGSLQPFGLVREDGSHKPSLGAWVEAVQMAEAQTPQWSDDKARIEQQISLLVENQRRILMGKWDEARMFLDAIDPAMAGKWTNSKFPICEPGCDHSG